MGWEAGHVCLKRFKRLCFELHMKNNEMVNTAGKPGKLKLKLPKQLET
jgi:hypothetical protein